jgi:2-oxoglutarate dehydrogenase E2 component (dihydrolipoamide succinyltransferase)
LWTPGPDCRSDDGSRGSVGDPVTSGEPLVEIDTDNVTHEIRSPVTGVLSKILVNDGGSVVAGTLLGTISQY